MEGYEERDRREQPRTLEAEADDRLEALLADPEYAFLSAHPRNLARIEEAPTAIDALDIALDLIAERLQRTFEFRSIRSVEGVELTEVNLEGIRSVIDRIKDEQEVIGEGGDAIVVVSRNEVAELPPVVCYKFAKSEETPRGRNPLSVEAEIQGEVYDIAADRPDSAIGVPMPYYATEMGNDKLIAMEKLPARSVDDVLRGKGLLPDWFDVDVFCDQLQGFLDVMHERNLYHRDMHFGNVMIRQSAHYPEDGKLGYLIDFGLTGYGHEGMDPYRKEQAGEVFTYNNDYAIINKIRRDLKTFQLRKHRNLKGI